MSDVVIHNIKGQRFGDWTVLRQDPFKRSPGAKYWHCQCACGKLASLSSYALRYGKTSRCMSCAGKLREAKRRAERQK